MGWLGEANVSCSLRHRCVQLRLARRWARSAVLAAGKGKGGCFYFFCFFTFIHFPSFPCPSPSSFLLSLLSLFSLSQVDDTKWPIRVDVSLNTQQINLCFQIFRFLFCCYLSLIFTVAFINFKRFCFIQTLWQIMILTLTLLIFRVWWHRSSCLFMMFTFLNLFGLQGYVVI